MEFGFDTKTARGPHFEIVHFNILKNKDYEMAIGLRTNLLMPSITGFNLLTYLFN